MLFSTLVNNCIKAIIVFFPWRIKRPLLKLLFKYDLAASAHIGFSWIYPSKLRMGSGSRIDSFNVALNLDFIELSDYSIISRNNWITGFPSSSKKFLPLIPLEPIRAGITTKNLCFIYSGATF